METPESILLRLEWSVIRRLDGLLQGDYRTLFHGFGLDLADLREYQLTDDVRHIDWNVTARMQTPYVRTYTEDRDVNAWFLLDLSPSVDFGTSRALKRDVLIEFVAVLARLLTRHGNRVGAMVYDGQDPRVIPAQGGRRQVLRLVSALLNQPRLRRAPTTDLSPLIVASHHLLRRRSLVFLVSDFFSVPGWEKSLGLLAQRHEVLAIRLIDPRERELPDIGHIVLEDAESGQQIHVDTHDRRFRQRFMEAAQRRDQALRAGCGRIGIDLAELSTEGDLMKEVMKLALKRRRQKAAPASSFAGQPQGLPRASEAKKPSRAGRG